MFAVTLRLRMACAMPIKQCSGCLRGLTPVEQGTCTGCGFTFCEDCVESHDGHCPAYQARLQVPVEKTKGVDPEPDWAPALEAAGYEVHYAGMDARSAQRERDLQDLREQGEEIAKELAGVSRSLKSLGRVKVPKVQCPKCKKPDLSKCGCFIDDGAPLLKRALRLIRLARKVRKNGKY